MVKRKKKEWERQQYSHRISSGPCSTVFHSKKLMHANSQEAALLPFQAFDAPVRSNRPPRSIVPTHEARVSHTIAATISIYPSGGKYTLVSKGMVHQSFTHIYLHRTWSCNFLLPLYTFVCSGFDVFVWYIHRLFKLSMVLRLNSLL